MSCSILIKNNTGKKHRHEYKATYISEIWEIFLKNGD